MNKFIRRLPSLFRLRLRIFCRNVGYSVDSITPQRLLRWGVVGFVTFFVFVSFARHDNFYSRRLDLGNMDQTVWNVLHGHGFILTDPMGTAQESRLAVHADFLMILLAPLYILWSNPKALILVQTIVVCLGAIPLYWIALDVLKSKKIALVFALGYLLYPPLERMMLHDFHAVALSTTFLLFAYWYMKRQSYVWFVFFALLAGLGKEQVWLTTGCMGVYIAIRNKRIIFGSLVAMVSFLVFYYLFWQVIPSVAPTKQHFALAYLSEFGEGQNSIIKNIIAQPWTVLHAAFLPDRLFYYFQLLAPVAFLPIFAPWTLLFCAHSVLINVLSNNGLMRQIDYQYTADITPFIFVAAMYGYASVSLYVRTHLNKPYAKLMTHYLSSVVIFIMVVSSLVWGELPLGLQSRFMYFISPQSEKKLMQQVEDAIPSMYTVSATNNIGSHFSQREYLYNFPLNALSTDYSVVMLNDQYAWPSGDAQKEMVNQLLQSSSYVLIAQLDNFYAFKRKGL